MEENSKYLVFSVSFFVGEEETLNTEFLNLLVIFWGSLDLYVLVKYDESFFCGELMRNLECGENQRFSDYTENKSGF